MSDYISKSALIETLENECKGQLIGNENVTLISFGDVIDLVFEQPTLDEKEIIRKAFERVEERLEEYMKNHRTLVDYEMFNGTYSEMKQQEMAVKAYEKAIQIIKKECGNSE